MAPQRDGGIPIWRVIFGATVLGTLVPIVLHYRAHGVLNVHQIGMAFFFWLNAIIAAWELCLFFRIDRIEASYANYAETYRGREFDRVVDFFATRIPARAILSADTWADVWASYALFDDSYADKKSYGFFIDIGNGFTTLVPSLLFVYGITYGFLPARVLGLVALLISYQMFYGTVLYLGSYILNRRYVGHDLTKAIAFVGISNGLWMFFPLWAMYLAVQMIYSDSFAVFSS